MKTSMVASASVFSMSLLLVSSALAQRCPRDSELAGRTCVDTYEASVWEIPDTQRRLIRRVRRGNVTEASLIAGGATLLGSDADDYGAACPDSGNGCTDVYAVSIAGVIPSRFITWFQAAAACRNAHKELLPNHVWQAAALGTPDTGGADDDTTTCNTDHQPSVVSPAPTGSRSDCFSDVGVFDMVGNLSEWVADWVPRSTGALAEWDFLPQEPNDDFMTMVGTISPDPGGPGALIRGGNFANAERAGVFTVSGANTPQSSGSGLGFRCGR